MNVDQRSAIARRVAERHPSATESELSSMVFTNSILGLLKLRQANPNHVLHNFEEHSSSPNRKEKKTFAYTNCPNTNHMETGCYNGKRRRVHHSNSHSHGQFSSTAIETSASGSGWTSVAPWTKSDWQENEWHPTYCTSPSHSSSGHHNYNRREYRSTTSRNLDLVRSSLSCRERGCLNLATHGYRPDGEPYYCNPHAREGMVNVEVSTDTGGVCIPVVDAGVLLEEVPQYTGQWHGASPAASAPSGCCPSGSSAGSSPRMSPSRITPPGSPSSSNSGSVIENANVCAPPSFPGDESEVCSSEGCRKKARFNAPGLPPTFCKVHALPGMTGAGKLCEHEGGCGEPAAFGPRGGKPQFCTTHRAGGTEYLKKICYIEGCNRKPLYGFPKERPMACGAHRASNMVAIRSRTCAAEEGCGKKPCFGFPGERVSFCREHARPGMRPSYRVCKHEGCLTQPHFGHIGESPRYCGTHRLEGMVNLVDQHCKRKGCRRQALYGVDGRGPVYCEEHAEEGMCLNRSNSGGSSNRAMPNSEGQTQ